jgi:hypothetical protein
VRRAGVRLGRRVATADDARSDGLLSEGVDGFLCRARDQLALREMLGRVSSTPRSELAAMGARARAKVLQRHDPEIYTRFFYDELHRVAGRTPPGTVRP